MRPIDRTLQALGQIQTITERAVTEHRMHPQVLRQVLGVIGETLRELREHPSDDGDVAELQRRLDLLLRALDADKRRLLAEAERGAGLDDSWLEMDEMDAAAEEDPLEPATDDDQEA